MERSLLIKTVIFALGVTLFGILHQQIGKIEDETSQTASFTTLYLLGGAILSLMAAIFFIPAIGDKVGQFFYSAPEPVKPDAGSKARALVAQGDFEGAMHAYLDLSRNNPEDRLPVVEAMRLARERLEDTPKAIEIVKDALNREWEEDDAAYFLFRLVEMYDEDLNDRNTALSLLEQVIESMPDTRHAANAHHKIRDWRSGQLAG